MTAANRMQSQRRELKFAEYDEQEEEEPSQLLRETPEGDDISAIAKRVLADLETFFDHDLCGDGAENRGYEEQEDGHDDWSEHVSGISLDELSVVVDASIQRHQSVVTRAKSKAALEDAAFKVEEKEGKGYKGNPQLRQSQLPFAHYQALLDRKTQLFHEKSGDARWMQESKHTRGRRETLRQGGNRWDPESSPAPSDGDGGVDEEEDSDADAESNDNDDKSSVDSAGSSSVASEETNSRTMSAAPTVQRSTSIRDAFTQATLQHDRSQQTSVANEQTLALPRHESAAAESMAPSCSARPREVPFPVRESRENLQPAPEEEKGDLTTKDQDVAWRRTELSSRGSLSASLLSLNSCAGSSSSSKPSLSSSAAASERSYRSENSKKSSHKHPSSSSQQPQPTACHEVQKLSLGPQIAVRND